MGVQGDAQEDEMVQAPEGETAGAREMARCERQSAPSLTHRFTA